MRKLVIDGQVFQTPALFRGMGKYSLELIKSLIASKEHDWNTFELVLSSRVNFETEELNNLLSKIPQLQIVTLDLKPNIIGDRLIVEHNRKAVEAHIGNEEVDYLVLSLMQGEIQPAFPKGDNIRNMVVFYDLIPLMFHKIYLESPVTREEYLSKLKELLKADLYLAISQTVANDLSLYLGVDRSRVISIDGGPIVHGNKDKKYPIEKPFILMPNGNDLRKNNRRGILGFEEFNKKHGGKYRLVITSFFKDYEIEDLKTLSSNLVFTGNISGEEMQYLYRNCEALLFPSEYEGLGLPILEAVESGKPIACSDISVFREMSIVDFDTFDPKDVSEIAYALDKAVIDRKVNLNNYKKILKKYTWVNTSKALIKGLECVSITPHADKRKVVMLQPDITKLEPFMRSQVLQHAELSRVFDIGYSFTTEPKTAEMRINYLMYAARLYTPLNLPQNALRIHQVDNSKAYVETLLYALAKPGVLILCSTDLERVWSALLKRKLISKTRMDLEKQLQDGYGVEGANLLTSLIANQKAIVVFDERSKEIVKKILTSLKKTTDVFVATFPTATARYPELFANKKFEEATLNNNGTIKILAQTTDFDFLEELAQTKKLRCSDNSFAAGSRNVLVLESMARGVVPEIDKEDSYTETKTLYGKEMVSFANEQTHIKFANQLSEIVEGLYKK